MWSHRRCSRDLASDGDRSAAHLALDDPIMVHVGNIGTRAGAITVPRTNPQDRVHGPHSSEGGDRPIPGLEEPMSGWGVQIRGNGLDTESKCWRCLEETVPDEDDLGLCDMCVVYLQDSPRSSRSRRSRSTTARA
jgi:hypothetical protein